MRLDRPLSIINASPAPSSATAGEQELGAMPEWNLTDLYAGMDSPEIKADLDRGFAALKAAR